MSWIRKIINRLFLKLETEPEEQSPPRFEILDNVWVKKDDKIYSGFIFKTSRRKITVSYFKEGEGFIDETFLKSDLNEDETITKNDLTIYFKKPCFTD